MALWSYKEVCHALGVEPQYDDFDITGLSIDTRSLNEGEMFIALKDVRDGHDFVQTAKESGASCALVEHSVDVELPQIIVPNVLKALEKLAIESRERSNAQRVAITGSAGKSTTKELMAAALGDYTHKPEKSFNNHWGVPLTLARMPKEVKSAVFEVGTNHVGEIQPLAELVKPDVAIIVNVFPVHIGNFNSLNELATEKFSIENGLKDSGILILPDGLAEQFDKKPSHEVITFGLTSNADVYAERIEENANGQIVCASVCGEEVKFSLSMAGQHIVQNALAVLAAVKALDEDIQAAASNMFVVKPLEGRGNKTVVNGITIIDESFNANPVSMKAALDTFKKQNPQARKIAILGDMLELGDDAQSMHDLMSDELDGLTAVFGVGPHTSHMLKNIDRSHLDLVAAFDDATSVYMQSVSRYLETGDAVMIKASKGTLYIHNFVEKLIKELAKKGQ